ncbi:class I SAM-dependent methyltransferase [Flavisolibacter sp. BT320]|nr:class I SAM-dependent methyltransferase [Flavisolibacter longurius]
MYAVHQNFKKNACYAPGHYYSVIVSVEEIRTKENEIWQKEKEDGIVGIDMQAEKQIQLLNSLQAYYPELPFHSTRQKNLRYYLQNDFFSYTDGILLYSLMRHYKPKRIIEIGSGFSSAVMLDTAEIFFQNNVQLTFIEPYPERLYSLIRKADKTATTIIEQGVQAVPLDVFAQLEAGDILFIDSSHVVKTGSDVNYILFDILPLLKPGILIHFHDVFYPFEYPKNWVFNGRNWNESYFLKAFLMYNQDFEIRLFSDYLHRHHQQAFAGMPLCYQNTGGSLWLEKK